MEEHHVSAKRKNLFKSIPDSADLLEFFYEAFNHGVYVCVTEGENEKHNIFVESESNKKYSGIVRVFYRMADAKEYAYMINTINGEKSVKVWTPTIKTVIPVLSTVNEDSEKQTHKPLRIMVSCIKGGQMKDLTEFWHNRRMEFQ
jgi:hypothetical protein